MRPAVLAAVFCLSVSPAISAQPAASVETLPINEIHAGMHGVAYTVFQGTKPEAMDVEVLGILKNVNGPKGDVILVRLGGAKVEYTGVVAGMSGSPVYFNGKLAGAVAFRIGEFSKEPIAGVTPIAEMLEISAVDRSLTAPPIEVKAAVASPAKPPARVMPTSRFRTSPTICVRLRLRWFSMAFPKRRCSALPQSLRLPGLCPSWVRAQ